MSIENEAEAEVIETEATEDSSTSNEETNNEAEGETGAQAEEQSERRTETPEAKRARLQRQLEQLNKKHGFKDEGGDNKPQAQKEVGGDDRFDRLELKTEGLKDKAEQDIVLDWMRYKKIDVMAALNSPAVKAELREYREKASTPSPSVRTGTQTKGVEYWARQVELGKSNSDDPKMRDQVRKYLQKKLTT